MQAAELTVGDLLKEQGERLRLELLSGEKSLGRRIIVSDLNRPGLALSGFLERFRVERVQIFGNGEQAYCQKAEPKSLAEALSAMLALPALPCVIVTHNAPIPSALAQACRRNGVPLIRSAYDTATLTGELAEALESRLAPTTTVHGVLVDVYGLGVLIQGDAGIGKSECALELLKRGHILVADDAVLIQHRRGGVLRGSCPEPLKNHMEVRGLGVIDVKLLFGIGAILGRTRVELAITLEPWNSQTPCDRTGLEAGKLAILEVDVPLIRIPVSPGRNLAVLIEVAALNQRLRSQGYFSAENFNQRLIERMRPKGRP
ncbi:MAG: HPr(Ser) kinase/phosphatase [Elusimicrobia bacterium]|nr:HPr(Ser) kinase/phosphatase [Elusimicrobiota bacterium]